MLMPGGEFVKVFDFPDNPHAASVDVHTMRRLGTRVAQQVCRLIDVFQLEHHPVAFAIC